MITTIRPCTRLPRPAGVGRPAQWARHLVIALLALGAYANSFPGAFIFDDVAIVRENPLVNDPSLGRILAADYWGEGAGSGLHRPLTILSYAVNRHLLGPGPAGFHTVNVLLHAVVSVLVAAVASAAGLSSSIGWVAAALFAVHPLHTEVVDIVTGRAELLAALFVLLALLAALRRGRLHRPLTAVCFAAALLSKESAATFLPLLLAFDLFGTRGVRAVARDRWRLYALVAAITVVWLAWRKFGLLSGSLPANAIYPEDNPLVLLGPAGRLLTVLKVQALYLQRLALPFSLNAVFVDTMIGPVSNPRSLQAVALVTGAVLLAVALVAGWRRRAPWSLGLAAHFLAFLATANVLVLTTFLVAERFAYLPSAGFCLAAAGAGTVLLRGLAPRRCILAAAAATAILALGGRTLARNIDFSSPAILWRAETRSAPGNYRAWILLGGALRESGDATGAEAALTRALELRPRFVEAALSLGYFLLDAGRPVEAAQHFQRILESGPGDSPLAMAGMVEAFLSLGQVREAAAWLEAIPPYFRHLPLYHALADRVRAAAGNFGDAGR